MFLPVIVMLGINFSGGGSAHSATDSSYSAPLAHGGRSM